MDYQARQTLRKQKQARKENIKGMIGAILAGVAMGLPFLISGLL